VRDHDCERSRPWEILCDLYRVHIDSLNTRVFRLLLMFRQGHLIDHTELSALVTDQALSLIAMEFTCQSGNFNGYKAW